MSLESTRDSSRLRGHLCDLRLRHRLAESCRAYYGSLGTASPGWTILVEAGRALVWTAIALPVIRMMKGQWWEAGLAVALLFGVLLGDLMLIPNAIMPDTVRFSHLVEAGSENFVFRWLVVLLLHRHYGTHITSEKRLQPVG